jgi:hypothetical protein
MSIICSHRLPGKNGPDLLGKKSPEDVARAVMFFAATAISERV